MIQGLWDRETVASLLLCALLPLAVTWLLAGGWTAVADLLFLALTIGIWHLIWMLARAQPPSVSALVTALAIAILVPGELGPVPILLGVSFGIVFGELAFGGWGRNILNPATIALAFIGFGFPSAPWPDLPVQIGWAAIPAALLAVALGVAAFGILAGACIVFALWAAVSPGLVELWPAALAVLVLLVLDPVASASTPFGRWATGGLYAALVGLFHDTWADAEAVQISVSAALLVALAAPLADETAVALWLARRRRRLG